jgi:hypothetical protein
MLNTLFLIGLAAALIIFLLWRQIPRAIFFEALADSVGIYIIAFSLSLNLTDRYLPSQVDGLLPCLPPIIPVIAFLAWFLSRARVVKR